MAKTGESAIVKGIYIAPDKGEPMVSFDTALATIGIGLSDPNDPNVQDRYASGRGAFSGRTPEPGESREVSLFPWEGLEEALEAARKASGNPELTVEAFAALPRRNIGVRGFGPDLTDLQGNELVDNETGLRILVTNECDPCDRPGRLAAKLAISHSGLDFRELLPGGRAGVRARTLENGMFVVNHTLEVA